MKIDTRFGAFRRIFVLLSDSENFEVDTHSGAFLVLLTELLFQHFVASKLMNYSFCKMATTINKQTKDGQAQPNEYCTNGTNCCKGYINRK